jgi:hypothetical protein
LLEHKHKHGVGRVAFDHHVKFLQSVALPKGNLLPKSGYLLKAAVGADDWQKYELHVCEGGPGCKGYVWDHITGKEWEAHKEDKCPNCNTSRFVDVKHGSRCRLKPRHWYIELGVEEGIRDFFANPEWCEQRGEHRDWTPGNGCYWGGTEARRLRDGGPALRIFTDRKRSSPYDLLLDWLEPYNSVAHSVGSCTVAVG